MIDSPADAESDIIRSELFFPFKEPEYTFIYGVVGANFLSEIEETVVELVHGHLPAVFLREKDE